jgi:hypothetical protein
MEVCGDEEEKKMYEDEEEKKIYGVESQGMEFMNVKWKGLQWWAYKRCRGRQRRRLWLIERIVPVW